VYIKNIKLKKEKNLMKNLWKKIRTKLKPSISLKQLIKEWAIYSIIKVIAFIITFGILVGIIFLVEDYIIAKPSFWIILGTVTFLILNLFDVYVKLKKITNK
jgi:hypothetical protein